MRGQHLTLRFPEIGKNDMIGGVHLRTPVPIFRSRQSRLPLISYCPAHSRIANAGAAAQACCCNNYEFFETPRQLSV